MGNVSGKKEDINEVKEEYMEYTHEAGEQIPYEMMQIPNNISSTRNTEHGYNSQSELGIPTMITWCYDGKQVAVQGSWDYWKTREFLQKTGDDFAVMKVLPLGVYHYRYIVDGQWRYSLDLPHERDDMGNVFNVLDVKGYVPPVFNNTSECESPPSPVSSYNNSPLTVEDYNEKLPELPPLLQQSPLDQPSASEGSLEKPLPSVLNHLYIQKGRGSRSLAALSSTHRFQSKHVTLVLYKPVKNPRK